MGPPFVVRDLPYLAQMLAAHIIAHLSANNAHNASMLTNRVTRSAFLFMMSPFLKFIKSSAGNCADVGTGISDRAADCLQNARTIHKLAILTRTAIDGMMRFHASLFAIA